MTQPTPIHQPRSRILCVDSNSSYLRLFLRELEPRGLMVEVAATGAEALHHLRSARYDLLCLATDLPDLMGMDVLHQIRADLGLVNLPVVVTSTGNLLDDLQHIARHPNVVLLRKPFSGVRLAALIKRILSSTPTSPSSGQA